LFLAKGYHDRFRQPLSDLPAYIDQQIYGVYPTGGRDVALLAGILNSAWFQLAVELTGRINFGDGVLWLGLVDARERLELPNPDGWKAGRTERVVDAFAALPEGRVPPVDLVRQDPNWAQPRERLDRELAASLGVSWREYLDLQIHGEVMCRRRINLAALRRKATTN